MIMKLPKMNKKATVSASIFTKMSKSLARFLMTKKYVKNLR